MHVQEVKDALDKEAVLRCMTACYELHQAEKKKKKMEGLSKGPDGSYLQSAKTLAAFGGSLLQGVVVSCLTGNPSGQWCKYCKSFGTQGVVVSCSTGKPKWTVTVM